MIFDGPFLKDGSEVGFASILQIRVSVAGTLIFFISIIYLYLLSIRI